MTLKEIQKGIEGVFVQPKAVFYLGRIIYGTPYFYPWNFCSSVLVVRKQKPKYLRCKHFKLFGYEISYGWPIYIYWNGLGWKDKFNSPRFEWPPAFYIFAFKWQFVIHWHAPDNDSNRYYEMILQYLKYSDKDIEKTKENWGWIDSSTKESTWNNDYLINNK